MKIGIVGGGISGLVAAYLLHPEHDVSLFEANDYIGGHTHTVTVNLQGRDWNVDTGFIVFNERAYPNFIELLKQLNVESQPTDMSFSVKCERTGLEYNADSINALFAQRRNLFSPAFYRMVRDILRFFREARRLLESNAPEITLGDYLKQNRYSREFVDQHLLPLGAAIWSTDATQMLDFPARFFIRFFDNHDFLRVHGRSQWRTVKGGSWRYVRALADKLPGVLHPNTAVRSIRRYTDRVELTLANGERSTFDHVIIAAHSDQALKMLADPSPEETEILGSIGYLKNDVVLHTDASLLPSRRRTWACWNYHLLDGPAEDGPNRTCVTYNMNMLQKLNPAETLCVTLNRTARINSERILGRYVYYHPHFTLDTVRAQGRRNEINGVRRTHYCGAYWAYGFHEDGVNSALAVARTFGKNLRK